MQRVRGAGCWPGQAEGRVVWMPQILPGAGEGAADRAAEVLAFRAAVGQALADLERWSELQPALEGRLKLQACREALLEHAWVQRVCALIDSEGRTAPVAAVEAAGALAQVLRRRNADDLADHLPEVARWIARRLRPVPLPPESILAAPHLSAPELLDLNGPALIASAEPPPVAGTGPVVWGVPGLGPDWHGRRVAADGDLITAGIPDPIWWVQDGDRLRGLPVCMLNGDPDALGRMERKLGTRPAAMIRRLDDLAAVPLFVERAAAVAVDLDRLGPAPRLKHPGFRLLIQAAAAAAQKAGVPLVAGGEPVRRQPDTWLAMGFTALFGPANFRGGEHALRIDAPGGL